MAKTRKKLVEFYHGPFDGRKQTVEVDFLPDPFIIMINHTYVSAEGSNITKAFKYVMDNSTYETDKWKYYHEGNFPARKSV